MNLSDIVLIIIIGACVLTGVKKGLVKTAIKVCSVFLSIIISFAVYPIFSGIILSSNAVQSISENINTGYVLPCMSDIIEEKTEALKNTTGLLGAVTKNIDIQTASAAEFVSSRITEIFVNVMTFLIIIILCGVLFRILSKLLLSAVKLPVLKQVNAIAGGAVGLLQGLIVCCLIMAAVSVLSAVNPSVAAVDRNIQNSAVASKIYNTNLIFNLFSANNASPQEALT